MGVRMTEIYFLFFAVIFIHSKTNLSRYVIGFVILAGAVVAIDFWRYNPSDAESAAQIMQQWIWPIGYLALTLLLPLVVKGCNAEKAVPERVTS